MIEFILSEIKSRNNNPNDKETDLKIKTSHGSTNFHPQGTKETL